MEQITRTRSAVLFLAVSLAAMGVGQLLLSFGRDFVDAQQPIDWAHWLILIGAVGGALSTSGFVLGQLGQLGRIARAFVVIGAIGFGGMVAIDLMLWTLPADPMLDDALRAALDSPQVAVPFLWVGPALFFIGLMLIAVEWVRLSARAAGLFIVGTLLNGVGAATRVDGITLVSSAIMLAGLGGLLAATSVRPLAGRLGLIPQRSSSERG
ncbi:hypothetical protein [Agromyces albus]|uniref:hypothetical protein n=1 Tax=Agromyces albus TaxID=205332 RepID=UPI0027804914|nr:hypothetical protein [Agromyces albus]MDQ0576848.1 hypothetical protein [Agromyces albus]